MVYVIVKQHLGNYQKEVEVYTQAQDAQKALDEYMTARVNFRGRTWRKMEGNRWVLDSIDEVSFYEVSIQ